jgi:hypothetical protein
VIASIYLEIMSVDGDMPTEVVGSSLALCSLSTRELQKQRNEVTVADCTSRCISLYFLVVYTPIVIFLDKHV